MHYHIVLSENNFEFDPVNDVVFYNESTGEFIMLNENDIIIMDTNTWETSEIKFKKDERINMRLPIKLSPDKCILTVQIRFNEILLIHRNEDCNTISVKCSENKKKGSCIKEFHWIGNNLLLITNCGIEIYEQVSNFGISRSSYSNKLIKKIKNNQMKLRKIVDKKINFSWYHYSVSLNLLLYPEKHGNRNVCGIHFRCMKSLEIFEIYPISIKSSEPLTGKDLLVTTIYNKVYCIYHNLFNQKLYLYPISYNKVDKDDYIVIDLYTPGNVFISVIDNLIVSHNISNSLSTIYDIGSNESNEIIDFLTSPLQIAYLYKDSYHILKNYSDCNFFFPNIVVNIKSGRIYKTRLNLDSLILNFSDNSKLIKTLLKRSEGKRYILQHLNMMTQGRSYFNNIVETFNLINEPLTIYEEEMKKISTTESNSEQSKEYKSSISSSFKERFLDYLKKFNSQNEPLERKTHLSSKRIYINENGDTFLKDGRVIITQEDIYTQFFVLMEENPKDRQFNFCIIDAYINSLNNFNIEVKPFIYNSMVDNLVRNNSFFKLHQLLQYRVVPDSTHVACQLLSIKNQYPPAFQLALDMLKRLNDPMRIIEVLLSEKLFIEALKYINLAPKEHTQNIITRIIEETLASDDEVLYLIIINHFKSKNVIIDDIVDQMKFQTINGKDDTSTNENILS